MKTITFIFVLFCLTAIGQTQVTEPNFLLYDKNTKEIKVADTGRTSPFMCAYSKEKVLIQAETLRELKQQVRELSLKAIKKEYIYLR